ncbi:MAG: hypothetical protein KIT37_13625, partial [Steroidobacteraceae bacterium]|nr:hypothetical protein [Steroidobacteraceae bacterium]
MTGQMDEPSAPDRGIERHWRAHSTEVPRVEIDAAIRAAARRELRQRRPWQRYAPLAAAASVGVLAFLLVRHTPRSDVTVVTPQFEPATQAATQAPPPAALPDQPPPVPADTGADSSGPPAPEAPVRAPSTQPAEADRDSSHAQEAVTTAHARITDEAEMATVAIERRAAKSAALAARSSAASASQIPAVLVELVITDAQRRAGVAPDEVSIVSAERIDEADAARGCAAAEDEAALPPPAAYRITV